MDSGSLLSEINAVFIDVLDNRSIVLTRETTAADIAEWDSLNHILLIIAIEKRFRVRFTTSEIRSWNNVGALCDALQDRLGTGRINSENR